MKLLSLKEWEKEFEHDYYMYIPLTIILNSCVGSIVAMKILYQGTTLLSGIALGIIVALCMGYNGALYAGLNRKFTFRLLLVSLAINLLFFIITLF